MAQIWPCDTKKNGPSFEILDVITWMTIEENAMKVLIAKCNFEAKSGIILEYCLDPHLMSLA